MWPRQKRKYRYLIYTPAFNERSGGIICLHYLCHLLNEIGEKAFVVPFEGKTTNPHHFTNPIAQGVDKGSASRTIVIYPEITDHNPLSAENVVRWLLHRPGFHSGKINFGEDELVVGYGAECSGSGYIINKRNSLIIKYIMDDVYHDNGMPKKKTCHMVRKAANTPEKKLNLHPEDSICIDRIESHQEIAAIFNECHTFISYDPYNYYSTYAALCGCTSIVIPDEGVTKKDWKADIKDTYGIAYGLNDLASAKKTRTRMLKYHQKQKKLNLQMAKKLVRLCEGYFDAT